MSVCFYNEHGRMVGIDIHEVIEVGKLILPLKVEISFDWWFVLTTKRSHTVTMDGARTFVGGADWYLVPHMAPAGPVASCTGTSGSKAWMAVQGVTIHGEKAATCTGKMFGSNQHCFEVADRSDFNVGINVNSVRTQPTPGDEISSKLGYYLDAALGAGVGQALGKLTGKLMGKEAAEKAAKEALDEATKEAAEKVLRRQKELEEVLKQVWRRAPDIKKEVSPEPSIADWLLDTPGQVTPIIQRAIDG